jgi:diguanylate cyclase (GGDEF)-like protein
LDGTNSPQILAFDPTEMGRLMPMHLAISGDGHIISHGPTLGKVLGGGPLIGRNVFSVFVIRRPGGVTSMSGLVRRLGQRLHLYPIGCPDDGVRGLAVPMAGGGLMLNLSFGIDVIDGVRRHGLTDADFSATDLTVELMYLAEAKSAVTHALRQLNQRLQGAKSVAEEQAMTDTLTGLRNRRAADLTLAALCDQGGDFSLMHMDLDFFKAVNDTLGHAAGDHVLRSVARILTAEIRVSDMAARIGGDEFLLILPGLIDPARLQRIAARIIDCVSEPMQFEGAVCKISASIGVTRSTLYGTAQPDLMLADADAALYASKNAGRAQVTIFAGT